MDGLRTPFGRKDPVLGILPGMNSRGSEFSAEMLGDFLRMMNISMKYGFYFRENGFVVIVNLNIIDFLPTIC